MTAPDSGSGWRPLREPVRPRGAAGAGGSSGGRGRKALASLAGAPNAFSRLGATHALVMAGDTLVTLALAKSVFFNLSPSEAKGKVALSLLLTVAPFGVVAPFLGPAIDRRKGGRRLMVIVSAAGRAVCCLLMARYIDSLLLFPFAFGSLVLSKAHAVCKAALVPATVDSEDGLVQANARLAMIGAIVGFASSGPGLAVSALFGADWLLRLDALVFVAGAISARRLAEARHDQAPDAGKAPARDPDAHREAGVYRAAVTMAVLRGIVGFLAFLLAFNLKDHTAWLGFALLLSVTGGLIGSALAPLLRGKLQEEWIVIGSLGTVVIAGLLTGRSAGRLGAALLAGTVGIAAGAARLAFDSLAQRDSPEASRGRAFARFEAAFQVVWVIGAVSATLIPFDLGWGLVVVAITAGVALAVYGVGMFRAGKRIEAGLPPKPPPTIDDLRRLFGGDTRAVRPPRVGRAAASHAAPKPVTKAMPPIPQVPDIPEAPTAPAADPVVDEHETPDTAEVPAVRWPDPEWMDDQAP